MRLPKRCKHYHRHYTSRTTRCKAMHHPSAQLIRNTPSFELALLRYEEICTHASNKRRDTPETRVSASFGEFQLSTEFQFDDSLAKRTKLKLEFH